MSKDTVFPIAVLIDDLKNEDANARLSAVKRIDQIAVALGPKRTRDEFIPFLCECVDDDDEILIELAQKLGKFVDPVGGPNYAPALLGPLRLLACADSRLVRDEAISSAIRVGNKLTDKDFATSFVPMVETLIKGEWYNHRTSGVGLAHLVFKRCTTSTVRNDLLEAIQRLAQDTLPMVRRTVAECLSQIVEDATGQEIASSIKTVHQLLGDDSQDSVRAVNIATTPYIMVALNKLLISGKDVSENVIQSIRDELYRKFLSVFCVDESWRVRHACADIFINVLEGYLGYTTVFEKPAATKASLADVPDCNEAIDLISDNKPSSLDTLKEANLKILNSKPSAPAGSNYDAANVVRAFAKLLSDEEPEVRCIAIQRVVRVASRISPANILAYLLPVLTDRASNDNSVFVRSALARNVVGLAQFIGKDDSIKTIKPVIAKLLEDRDPDVRVTTLLSLPHIIEVTGVQPFTANILPTVVLLADDSDWRIRKSVVQAIPGIAKDLGVAFFDEKLSGLCMNWLSDTVNYIRRAAVRNLVQLSTIFGQEWTLRVLVPKITTLKQNSNYLQRINALFFIQELAAASKSNIVAQHLVPIALRMATDPIPNVRFMAAETLGKCAPYVPAQCRESQMKPCLMNLTSDVDVDVKTFAKDALKNLQ